MPDFAQDEIERGMDEKYPFGFPKRPKRRKRSPKLSKFNVSRYDLEARDRACDEIAGYRIAKFSD